MVPDFQKQSAWRCLALLSLCSAGAEVPGTPFPAFPCLSPLTCSLWGCSCPPALARSSHTRSVSSTATGLSPSFGTMLQNMAKEEWVALCHSPSFHAQPICPQASLKGLFVPSLASRLKSSYPRQRKRNILQVCNSLKHWTCSKMTLL